MRDRFREETARALLAAAEEVFADDGLHGASMAHIAERAGVAVGTVYNHFKDREALLEALLDQRRAELLSALDRTAAELAKEPFARQLEAFLEALFRHFEEHRAFLRIVLSSEYGSGSKCGEFPSALHQRFEALLRVGHREKILRADPDHVFAGMLLGAVRATFLREKYGAEPLEPATAVASVAAFFLRGAGR